MPSMLYRLRPLGISRRDGLFQRVMITEKCMELTDDKLNQVAGGYDELRPGESYDVELYCPNCSNRFWVYDQFVPQATDVCPCCGTTTSHVYHVSTSFG